VIEVEKTVSPKMLFELPNDFPAKDWPVLRCRMAGMAVAVAVLEGEEPWVAKVRVTVRATSGTMR